MSNLNAHFGKKYEQLFAKELANNKCAFDSITEAIIALGSNTNELAVLSHIDVIGHKGNKTDVIAHSTSGATFRASVKSFSLRAGFNQVARMSIDNFAQRHGIEEEIVSILKSSTIAKAQGITRNWIDDKDSNRIIQALRPKAFEIVRSALVEPDEPDILVLAHRDVKQFLVFLMDEVLQYVRSSLNVHITSQGVISLNRCFTIQKKGGNGKGALYPKDDLRHGGNNIQIKMKCLQVIKALKPLTTITY